MPFLTCILAKFGNHSPFCWPNSMRPVYGREKQIRSKIGMFRREELGECLWLTWEIPKILLAELFRNFQIYFSHYIHLWFVTKINMYHFFITTFHSYITCPCSCWLLGHIKINVDGAFDRKSNSIALTTVYLCLLGLVQYRSSWLQY